MHFAIYSLSVPVVDVASCLTTLEHVDYYKAKIHDKLARLLVAPGLHYVNKLTEIEKRDCVFESNARSAFEKVRKAEVYSTLTEMKGISGKRHTNLNMCQAKRLCSSARKFSFLVQFSRLWRNCESFDSHKSKRQKKKFIVAGKWFPWSFSISTNDFRSLDLILREQHISRHHHSFYHCERCEIRSTELHPFCFASLSWSFVLPYFPEYAFAWKWFSESIIYLNQILPSPPPHRTSISMDRHKWHNLGKCPLIRRCRSPASYKPIDYWFSCVGLWSECLIERAAAESIQKNVGTLKALRQVTNTSERWATWKTSALDIEILSHEQQLARLSGHKKMENSAPTFHVYSTCGILLKSIA